MLVALLAFVLSGFAHYIYVVTRCLLITATLTFQRPALRSRCLDINCGIAFVNGGSSNYMPRVSKPVVFDALFISLAYVSSGKVNAAGFCVTFKFFTTSGKVSGNCVGCTFVLYNLKGNAVGQWTVQLVSGY